MARLLNFMVALRRLPPLSELTGEEERLLFELREEWERRGSLGLNEVYTLRGAKSASTAYRTTLALAKTGLIEIRTVDGDRRRRTIAFTDVSERLFKSVS